jgi:hypothetical protein
MAKPYFGLTVSLWQSKEENIHSVSDTMGEEKQINAVDSGS